MGRYLDDQRGALVSTAKNRGTWELASRDMYRVKILEGGEEYHMPVTVEETPEEFKIDSTAQCSVFPATIVPKLALMGMIGRMVPDNKCQDYYRWEENLDCGRKAV